MTTRLLRSMTLALAAGVTLGAQVPPVQTPAVPQHKHYETPPEAAQAPAPGQPVAPRLQNLGVHTFLVSTKVPRAQVFINQGVNLGGRSITRRPRARSPRRRGSIRRIRWRTGAMRWCLVPISTRRWKPPTSRRRSNW